MHPISEQIVAARKAKGMTQEALAQALNVSRSALAHWESGRTLPNLDMLSKLSRVLEVDLLNNFTGSAVDESPAPGSGEATEGQTSGDPTQDIAEAPAGSPEEDTVDDPVNTPVTPPPRRRAIRGRVLIAVAAALVCIGALLFFLLPRKPEAVPAVGEAVDAATITPDYFKQNNPEQAGKAYFTLDCVLQTNKSQDIDIWMYTLNMHEKHGVAFSIDRLDTYTFVGDVVDERSFSTDFLSGWVSTDVEPYGDWSINGGLPVDEKVRGMGFVVHGKDATGAALSFVFYQPLASA